MTKHHYKSSKSKKDCSLCALDAPKKSVSCSNESNEPKNQAWDIYFFTSTLTVDSMGMNATSLNNNVLTHSDPAAFLIEKCWQWFDGKCDKHHRICPSDLHISYVNVGVNNCVGGTGQGNLSSVPLAPELCCTSNCNYAIASAASQSSAPGVPTDGVPLVSTIMGAGNASCESFPVQPETTPGDVAPPLIKPGTILLRVCFNTASNCIYIKTNTTVNKFSRFTCNSGGWPSTTKCIYSLGQSTSRCSTLVGGLPMAGNSAITVLKADNSPIPGSNCNDSTTYCYFSGALAGAQATTIVQCSDGNSPCGQPQGQGLFGNCSLTIADVCPNYLSLGYAGMASDLPFTQGSTGNGTTSGSGSVPGFGGLSAPYTYLALTWNDPNGQCCPSNNKYNNWW